MQDGRAYTAQPVIVPMPDQRVSDDIIFSTFSLHFCNPCCLGFGAFYNSIKVSNINICNYIIVLLLYKYLTYFMCVRPGTADCLETSQWHGLMAQSSPSKHCCRHYWFHPYTYLHHHHCQCITTSAYNRFLYNIRFFYFLPVLPLLPS